MKTLNLIAGLSVAVAVALTVAPAAADDTPAVTLAPGDAAPGFAGVFRRWRRAPRTP